MTAATLEATTDLFIDQYGLDAAHISTPFTEFVEEYACDCCKAKRKGVFIQVEGIRFDTYDSLFKVCKSCVKGF